MITAYIEPDQPVTRGPAGDIVSVWLATANTQNNGSVTSNGYRIFVPPGIAAELVSALALPLQEATS